MGPEEPRANGDAGEPEYEQLLMSVYSEGSLRSRFHLRFIEGDESYSCLWRGELFVGLFHDASLTEEAREIVRRSIDDLPASLLETTLAEARLRPADSADFMDQVMRGAPMTLPGDDPCAVVVAVGAPDGRSWKGTFTAPQIEELPRGLFSVLEGCCFVATRIAEDAKRRAHETAPAASRKPWWRFW